MSSGRVQACRFTRSPCPAAVDNVALRHVAPAVDKGPASLYAYFDNRDVLIKHAPMKDTD